jgi:hypothetical protein
MGRAYFVSTFFAAASISAFIPVRGADEPQFTRGPISKSGWSFGAFYRRRAARPLVRGACWKPF